MTRPSGPWSLLVADRHPGREMYATSWAVEKLAKVVEGVAEAMDTFDYRLAAKHGLRDALYEAFRNACKLASWMGGNSGRYEEEEVARAFNRGPDAMRALVEVLMGVAT